MKRYLFIGLILSGFLGLGIAQQLTGETWYDAFMRRSYTYDAATWYHVEIMYPAGPSGEHGFAQWRWTKMVPPGGEIILLPLSILPNAEEDATDGNSQTENVMFNYGQESAISASFGRRGGAAYYAPPHPISMSPENSFLYWLQDESHANGTMIIRHPDYIDRAKMLNGAVLLQGGAYWINNLLSDHFLDCYGNNQTETVVAEVDLTQSYTARMLALRYWIRPTGTPTIKLQTSQDRVNWTTIMTTTGTGAKSGGFMNVGVPYHDSWLNISLRHARITQQGVGMVCPMKLFAWVAN